VLATNVIIIECLGVKIDSVFHGHMGAVTDIERSPFFPDLIMTTGGWSFHILKEGLAVYFFARDLI
jgi:hypothetical protein